MSFWQAIVESNTFNFAVLLLIFAVLFSKLNVSAIIEKIKSDIIQAIENAKSQHKNAEEKLKKAQFSVEHLDDEINEKIENANKTGAGLAFEITESAKKQIQYIKDNIEKVITAEEKTIEAGAIDTTLKNAIELAKEKIKNQLKNNPQLHDKFIEESIGAL